MSRDPADKYLKAALIESYAVRANVFHRGVTDSRMRELYAQIDAVNVTSLTWDTRELHITDKAIEIARSKSIVLHTVFVHPELLQQRPQFIAYYRNLVAISKKGMAQMGLRTDRFEQPSPPSMDPATALSLARALNSVLSRLIEAQPDFALIHGRDVIFAEIGSELQGTWANAVGKRAAKAVEDILKHHIEEHQLGEYQGHGRFSLHNGWEVRFGSEPDIQFLDSESIERIAVEIKGSLDRAGAQTRYGEAKKSFAKSRAKNPRCHTVYLASCFTESVERQIKADGQVSEVLNLTSILHDAKEQRRFLKRLFYIVDAPV